MSRNVWRTMDGSNKVVFYVNGKKVSSGNDFMKLLTFEDMLFYVFVHDVMMLQFASKEKPWYDKNDEDVIITDYYYFLVFS